MEEKDSIVFYKSWLKGAQLISKPAERLSFYEAVFAYAFRGEEIARSGSMAEMAFIMIKPQLDANLSRARNGKRGGRPKKETIGFENDENKKTNGFENDPKKETNGFLKTQEIKTNGFENSANKKTIGFQNNAQEKTNGFSKEKERLKEKENIYINNNLLQEKEKEIYKEKEKESSSFTASIATKKRSFTPPTLEEITEYCKSRNNSIDPKTFYDYYSAPNAEGKTWIDRDGTPVKNWKQKVITWEGRRKNAQLGKEPYEETRTKRQWNISYDVDGTKG